MEATYTTLELRGSMAIALVVCVSRNPAYCHDFPASVDLNIPSPVIMSPRISLSPVPANITLGFDGATASAPMLSLSPGSVPSEIFTHLIP